MSWSGGTTYFLTISRAYSSASDTTKYLVATSQLSMSIILFLRAWHSMITHLNNSTCSRVEGRLFYGHKIVLVSESPRLRAMLAPPRADAAPASAPPLVQINDIRYHIFEVIKISVTKQTAVCVHGTVEWKPRTGKRSVERPARWTDDLKKAGGWGSPKSTWSFEPDIFCSKEWYCLFLLYAR